MAQSNEDVRAKVTELRREVGNSPIMQAQMRADPKGFLASHGFSPAVANDLLNEGTESRALADTLDCNTTCVQTGCVFLSIG